jgi:hypothetical protein
MKLAAHSNHAAPWGGVLFGDTGRSSAVVKSGRPRGCQKWPLRARSIASRNYNNKGECTMTAKTHDTVEIGDRVVLRGAEEAGCGTVTDILEYGMIRVRWEQPELNAIYRRDQLTKLSER